jgi:hypothetical protein
MRGYPKRIATKRDFENLISMPEYKDRALADLEKIIENSPAKIKKAVAPVDAKKPDGEWETEEIDNPLPLWKLKGFKSKKAVTDLIGKHKGQA